MRASAAVSQQITGSFQISGKCTGYTSSDCSASRLPLPPESSAGACFWGPCLPARRQQFADARDDLAAVQLDVGHELVVRQARHAVLQVEPGGLQGAEVRGDLLRDGLG